MEEKADYDACQTPSVDCKSSQVPLPQIFVMAEVVEVVQNAVLDPFQVVSRRIGEIIDFPDFVQLLSGYKLEAIENTDCTLKL